jgi:hypothetical protein
MLYNLRRNAEWGIPRTRVINVKREAPRFIQRFESLLWANMPTHWQFYSLYIQNKLYVTIITGPDPDDHKTCREYLSKDIKGRANDIWGLACDCAQEIINDVERV